MAYPFCPDRVSLRALVPDDDTRWGPDAFGMLSPLPEYSREIDPEDIDFVIVPCTAFDLKCRRLGMGAGIYDRFLPKCSKAVKAAAAFYAQRAEELYSEEHDVALDMVVTENGIIYAENEDSDSNA